MGNVWYNEPKTLDTAFDVMGDIILSTAAQQYGGFTVTGGWIRFWPLMQRKATENIKKNFEICGPGVGACTGQG